MPYFKMLHFWGGILLILPYSLPAEVCFGVEDTCDNGDKYNSTIQYAGETYFGSKKFIMPQNVITYNNITEFIGENICDNYTFVSALRKDQYNKKQKKRDDRYTFYGNSGSIIASGREQEVHIARRVVIEEPGNVLLLKTNLNTSLLPDSLTMNLWWDHFYTLLVSSSLLQVKKIKNITKSKEGHSYKLDCETGNILTIADFSCVYLQGHQTKFSPVLSTTCGRKLPVVFKGSVIVKCPLSNVNAKRSCTNSHYICATGEATARAVHIIKTHLNAPYIAKNELGVSDVEHIFDCSCSENEYMSNVDGSNCSYSRNHLTPDRLEILNHESLSIKKLCLRNPKCHYSSSMLDSLRPCRCVGQDSQVAIEHYHNEYGMLKNPTGADGLSPCKTFLPYGGKDSFQLVPPFKRIKYCETAGDNVNGDYGYGMYSNIHNYSKITSHRVKRRMSWGASSWVRRIIKDKQKLCQYAASAQSVQKMQKNIQKTFKEEYEALKHNEEHDNLVTNRINSNTYQIVKINNVLEDVILEFNRDLSIIEKEITNIQMKMELNRLQIIINEFNTHRIRAFLMRMHKKKLNLIKGDFRINETSGCAQVPDDHADLNLNYLDTITPYSMLKPINSSQFRFTIEPPVHINSIHQHYYFRTILIVVVLLVFIMIITCACKFMC